MVWVTDNENLDVLTARHHPAEAASHLLLARVRDKELGLRLLQVRKDSNNSSNSRAGLGLSEEVVVGLGRNRRVLLLSEVVGRRDRLPLVLRRRDRVRLEVHQLDRVRLVVPSEFYRLIRLRTDSGLLTLFTFFFDFQLWWK